MHSDCTFSETCGVCEELETLEKEVVATQETLRKLFQKRISLKSSRNAVHDRLSTKLPVEIVCQIFLLVEMANNHSYDTRPPFLSKDYRCSPIILSSVSLKWREIALSLQELWTNVYINLWRKPDQVIEDWLSRSGSLPLNLTLYVNKERPPESMAASSVCNILRLHSARWQHLDVGFAAKTTLYNLFNKLAIMPETDSFHLHLGEYNHEEAILLDKPLRPGRVHAKSMRVLKAMPCEWNNLTCLELARYGIGQALDIIRAAPKLKRCVSRKMRSDAKTATPVEHKLLDDLDISFKGSGTKFFQNITLPGLRHLRYDSHPYPGSVYQNEEFHDLESFLVRSELSPTSLRTFSLGYYSFFLDDHDGFLELAGVTDLSIDIWPRSTILESLCHKMFDIFVFPNLQYLRCKLMGSHPNIVLAAGPSPFPALHDFVTEHNSKYEAREDYLEKKKSSGSTLADDDTHLPQSDTQDLNLIYDEMPRCRPFKFVSIQQSTNLMYATVKSIDDEISRSADFPSKILVGY